MVDANVITAKLLLLEEYYRDLTEIRDNPDNTLDKLKSDKWLRRSVERTLQLAVECALDIGSHIISSEYWREPTDNKDIFAVLAENGVVTPEKLPTLQKMAQFRNVLVHDYARLDPAILYAIVHKNLADIEYVITAVKAKYIDEV